MIKRVKRHGSDDFQFEIIKKDVKIAKRIYKDLKLTNEGILSEVLDQIVYFVQLCVYLDEGQIRNLLLCKNIYQLDRLVKKYKYQW